MVWQVAECVCVHHNTQLYITSVEGDVLCVWWQACSGAVHRHQCRRRGPALFWPVLLVVIAHTDTLVCVHTVVYVSIVGVAAMLGLCSSCGRPARQLSSCAAGGCHPPVHAGCQLAVELMQPPVVHVAGSRHRASAVVQAPCAWPVSCGLAIQLPVWNAALGMRTQGICCLICRVRLERWVVLHVASARAPCI